MRRGAVGLGLVVALLSASACGGDDVPGPAASTPEGGATVGPVWAPDARVVVSGHDTDADDCRTRICRHNENTDLTRWNGAVWLVHRTAQSQILGPNSALHVYRSDDGGAAFTETAIVPAPSDRDIRDPHFFAIGDELCIKALTRLPVNSIRDANVDTIARLTCSSDGAVWSPLVDIGPPTWSYWRIKESDGVSYTAAYEDGDKSVVLFSSADGKTWQMGATVYDVAADTPLETELAFLDGGRLLALVRMDGTDAELLGDGGRLRTKICWADPPYDAFDCPAEIEGQRLDGPLSFLHGGRLFVVARKHLQGTGRKRTALFEITGDLQNGGALDVVEHGELPSAGDTSYAGAVDLDDHRTLVTWYSGDLDKDEGWALGMFDVTDIWQATIDFDHLGP